MEVTGLLEIRTREEFRKWLSNNHDKQRFCWITISKGSTHDSILYLDAVEEAICFGWIDGTIKKSDDGRLVQRFSPRQKKSNWTELNKERARRLERLGLMTDAGRRILPDMDEELVIHPTVHDALKADREVYNNFLKFPELYKRVHLYNIHHALEDGQHEIFQKRLDRFIENTKKNKMYGSWNDDGRLLEK